MNILRFAAVMTAMLIVATNAPAQTTAPTSTPFRSSLAIRTAAWNDDEWFKSAEASTVATNVLSLQNDNGGWPKNYNALNPQRGSTHEIGSTIDNGATYSELRFLARLYKLDPRIEYKIAFDRGLKYVFDAQYDNGGWPQRFPLQDDYSRHITFNDGATVGVMRLLEAIRNNAPEFAIVSDDDRARSAKAFDRGINCILSCQLKINGTLVGWCQQHDAKTLEPAWARKFEPPCIASNESAGLAMLLMSQPSPDARMRASIEAVMKWFDDVKVTGKRYVEAKGLQYENGYDRVLVDDPAATQPIWARMYETDGTNRPFFCGRDSVKKYSLAEVEYERRTGYGWYGRWPSRAIEKYDEWKKRTEK